MSVLALAQPALGVVTQAGASANAAWIAFHNDSPYDLLVAFNTQAPAVPLTPDAGLAGWDTRIAPGHYWTQYMPPRPPLGPQYEIEQSANSFPLPFQGRLQLLLINYGGTAANGTQSVRANVWIQSGTAQEQAPDYSAALPYGSAFQQQRVVSVPLGIVPIVGTFSATSGGKSVIFPTFNLSAANLANQVANVYLYGGMITMQHQTSTIALNVEFVILNAGLSVLSTAVLWSGELWANNTNNTHDTVYLVNGPVVYVANISLAGLTLPTQVGLQLHCNGLSGTTPAPVTFTIAWALDTTNLGFPWAVGSQVGYFNSGTGNGPY